MNSAVRPMVTSVKAAAQPHKSLLQVLQRFCDAQIMPPDAPHWGKPTPGRCRERRLFIEAGKAMLAL
jgi:hypothetical protein